MRLSTTAIASILLITTAQGCYRGGALLGTAIGASIVTAAVVSSRSPPPPRVVYAPPPRHGYVWQPGYWTLQDREWVWIEGHWAPRYPGYDWEPARWVRDPDGHWRLLPGQWVESAAVARVGPPGEPPPPPPPQ